jgi:DNA-binding response OmpR family regulator
VDGDLTVDLARWKVRLDEEAVHLSSTEFLLLACLVKHVGEVVPHEWLLMEGWGPDYEKHNGP